MPIIISDVPMAFLTVRFTLFISSGTIKNPLPAPINPVKIPTYTPVNNKLLVVFVAYFL